MGIFDGIRALQHSVTLDTVLSEAADETIERLPVETLYRDQPYLRTVVDFLARNVAQVGLHVYKRDADGSRVRLRDHPLALTLASPNETQTQYDLITGMVSELALYDAAYLMVEQHKDAVRLRLVPNRWIVGTYDSTPWTVGGYEVDAGGDGTPVRVPAADMLVFHGWNPADIRMGCSPVEALRATLVEQLHAAQYRQQLWARGGRVGSYITRPKDAPKWSNEGRARFQRQWRDLWSGGGHKAGGTPLLDEGMELKRVGFSAKEEEFVEASKLSLQTVAGVYHVNPTMLGQLDNANYSNVREFRKMLYGDTLGPILAMIEARLNQFLVKRFTDHKGVYVEFNLGEKLEGSFEEQAAVLSAAVGGPYMTPNEARAKMNMPAIAAGDGLYEPLNLSMGQPESGAGDGK